MSEEVKKNEESQAVGFNALDEDDEELEDIDDVDDEEPELPAHLEPKVFHVVEEDVKNRYEIRELTGEEHAKWMSRSTKRFRDKRGRPRENPDFKGLHADLICMCVFDKSGKKVTPSRVDGWGPKCKARVYRMCQEHQGLAGAGVDNEGNG